MSKHKPPADNWLHLLRLCRERHVPCEIEHQWNHDLAATFEGDAKEAEALAQKLMDEVIKNYPYIPPETYLAEIEKTQDWEKLRIDMSIYWKDLPSMLTDAVRWGCHHTVKQLAFHCVFDNEKLLDELLLLAPDQQTKTTLQNRMGVREETHYRNYPFCIKRHFIRKGLGFSKEDQSVVSLPDNVQQIAFEQLVKRNLFGSEQDMLEQMLAIAPKDRGWLPLEFYLFALGCEATENGFVFRPIPEYWFESEYADLWKTKDLNSVLTYLPGAMADFEFKFDGLNNCFGYTGYYYLEKWL